MLWTLTDASWIYLGKDREKVNTGYGKIIDKKRCYRQGVFVYKNTKKTYSESYLTIKKIMACYLSCSSTLKQSRKNKD